MRDAASLRLGIDTAAPITRCKDVRLTGRSRRSRCWRMVPASASRNYLEVHG